METTDKRRLADLYSDLEGKEDLSCVAPSFFEVDSDDLEERKCACVESLSWRNLYKIDFWPAVAENKDWCVSYLKRRANEATNPILRYRYNLFLCCLTKNNLYAGESINAILEFLPHLLTDDGDKRPSKYEPAVSDLIYLAKNWRKDKVREVSDCLWKVLQSDACSLVKLVTLMQSDEGSLFGVEDAAAAARMCKELLPDMSGAWREHCCNAGLHYAAKMPKNGREYSAYFYEALGDAEMSQVRDVAGDPPNIVLPHQNRAHIADAVKYYRKAGAQTKMQEAQRQYQLVGQELKYIHVVSSVPTNENVVSYYRELKKSLLESHPSFLVNAMICSSEFFCLPTAAKLDEYGSSHDLSNNVPGFVPVVVDVNNNTYKPDPVEFAKARFCKTWIDNIMRQSILEILLPSVASGHLTYVRLRSYLMRNTVFGVQFASGCWFDRIDFALKDLFKQYKRYAEGQAADWRIAIDILPLKLESMLRDIVGLEGGKSLKVNKHQDFEAVLLEGLLDDSVLRGVFSDDDLLLFKFTFTSWGENIRNNVAHGFYGSDYYDIYKATLVFLCVLRLAKYRYCV